MGRSLYMPTTMSQLDMPRGWYKSYCYIMLHGYQTSRDNGTYVRTDEAGQLTAREVAKACGVTADVSEKASEAFKARGLMARRRHKDRAGSFMYLPEQPGWDYARMDAARGLRCFAYGAPKDAWGVYALAHDVGMAFGMGDPWGDMRREIRSPSLADVEFATEWLLAQGLVRMRHLWSGDGYRMVLEPA